MIWKQFGDTYLKNSKSIQKSIQFCLRSLHSILTIIELRQLIYFSRNLEPLRYSSSNKLYCHFTLEVKLVDWFSIVEMVFATALQCLRVFLSLTLFKELILVEETSPDISKLSWEDQVTCSTPPLNSRLSKKLKSFNATWVYL